MVRPLAATALRWLSVLALFVGIVGVATFVLPATKAFAYTTLPASATVSSTSAWNDSGISLAPHTYVTFSASGTIGGVPDSGSPAGSPWPACVPGTEGFYYGPLIRDGFACWSLIGKFGTTGAPFEIGTGATVASTGGELYLSVNDNYFSDNYGSWSVYLTAGTLVGGSDGAQQRIGGGAGAAPGTCVCPAGEPVDPATGDFYTSATDVSLPTFGPALTFTRTYDAVAAQQEAAASTPGPLGYGWTDNWAASLALNTAYATPTSGDITFDQANGAEALFVPPSGGSCPSPYVGPGSSGTYCALPRVLASLTYNSGSSTYTLVEHPKTTYTFNSTGQLISIADPDGATETVTYNSPSPGTGECPAAASSCETVTSASGRALTLGWSNTGDSGTITSVTDPLGRRTTYAYSSGNLSSVTDPMSRVTSYTYDSSNSNSDLVHDLLTLTKPNGQSGGPDAGDALTNVYNSSGQITSQTDPKGLETSFDYSGYTFSTLTGTVVVTDPDGNETAFVYTQGALISKSTGYGTSSVSTTTYSVDPSTLLDDIVTDGNGHATTSTYDADGNVLVKLDGLYQMSSFSYNSFDEVTCASTPLLVVNEGCNLLSPPSALTAGSSTITPPSSAPLAYVTYAEFDTNGNPIYTTQGDYNPGSSSASQSRTTYDLYNGQSVTLGTTVDSCTTSAPNSELPCAKINADGTVTQLAYDSAGDLTSSSTPDGNSGGEVATTAYSYDTDGEQTSSVAPDGNLSGANAGNYTTSTTYNADGEKTTVTVGGGSGHTVVPRVTTYTYDADGNVTATSHGSSPNLVGTTSGSNSSSSLSLSLPAGTKPGDEAVLSTTTSPSGSASAAALTAGDIYDIVGMGVSGSTVGAQANMAEIHGPQSSVSDAAGDLYVVSLADCLYEVPAANGTQWGQSMTAGDLYSVAGACGTAGHSGDGGAASSARLDYPTFVTLDASGDIYVSDGLNNRVQEIAATTHSQWGQSMTAGDVYTIAGSSSGTSGNSGDGGAATSAKMNFPVGLTFDANGDLYIADEANNQVREVAATTHSQWGQSMTAYDIYTVAGSSSGTSGSSGDGGTGSSAKLASPWGITSDSAGDVYIADSVNNRIQELAAGSGTQWGQSMTAGDIYTVAGSSSGTSGDSGDAGAATSALLNTPTGVVLDGSGNLYVVDSANNRIQEVAHASGTQWGQSMTVNDVYTVSGNATGTSGASGNGGPATSATLDDPQSMSLDPHGDLMIDDYTNNAVREVAASSSQGQAFTANDVYDIVATGYSGSSGLGGEATFANLVSPVSTISDPAGDLYIGDVADCIDEVPATSGTQWGQSMTAGDIYTVAGQCGSSGSSGDGGAATSALLDSPQGLSFDANGDLIIGDSGNNRVQELAATTHSQWGQSMTANDIYTIAGSASGTSGTSGDGGAATSALLNYPAGFAFDANGDLIITDNGNNRVQELAATTHSQWGQSMTANDIYTIAGSSAGTSGHSGDGGAAASALLNAPLAPTIDTAGDIYIPDNGNNRVQEVAAASGTQWGQSMTAGDIYTVAGSSSGTSGHSGDGGAGTSALLNGPAQVTLDSAGNLYVADANNNRVQELANSTGTQWGQSMTAGDIYTIAGSSSGTSGHSGDGGAATSAKFFSIQAISFDPYGNLVIADSYNHTVRELASSAGSGSESVTTPSGYTLVDSKTTGQTTTDVWTHAVTSTDTGVTLSYSSAAPKVASLAVYSGVNTTTPVDVYDDATTSSGTSVTAAALTTSNPGDELVLVAGAGQEASAGTWTAPSGLTGAAQAQDSDISTLIADGSGPASAGSTGSETATTSVTGQLAAVFVALTPGTSTTATSYDADDEATLVTDADGNATLTCYDGDGNVAETVPPVGVAADSLTASSCPTAYPSDYGDRLATDATTYAYNALNDKTTVTTPAPSGLTGYETTTYAYDAAGNPTSVTAPPTSTSGGAPDQVTDYTYDADNELLTTTTASGTTAAATTLNCYDPNGELAASVPGDGNVTTLQTCSTSSPYDTSSNYQTTYAYDSLGDMVTSTAPATTWATSGQMTTDTYDAAGNQLTSEDPEGVTTTNTYTPLNQLATTSYSDSTHEVTDTYDADGQRTQMTDATGTSTYGYDPFGEMTAEENGASKTVDYSYDNLGDTTAVTYPLGSGASWASSDAVHYGYDAAGQLSSVADFNGNTVSVANTADGLPSSLTLGATGDTISTSYDPTDSPSSVTLSNGSSTLQEFSYSDEPAGVISSETDTPSSSLSPADYTYDANSRVTSLVPGSGSTDSYAFDASDNLTTLPGGATGTYDHASELTSSVLSGTTTNYTYNTDGQRTQEAVGGSTTVSATYNGARDLTSYSDAAANMSTASYDGDGLRASETSTPTGGSSTPQSFVYDTSSTTPQLLMDSTNAYVYGSGGTPLEQINLTTGTVQYLVGDALGSVRGVVNASGGLVNSTSYDAWGNPETSGGVSAQTPFGFAGGYTDPSGLIYLVHRYYDPGTGQFLSVDPLVGETGQPYQYAEGDPPNASDPNGLDTQGACVGGQLGVGPITGSMTVCLVRTDNQKQTGITVTGSNPLLVGANVNQLKIGRSGASFWTLVNSNVNTLLQNSNASCLAELGGDFNAAGVSAGFPEGGSYQHAGDSAGISVYTYGLGFDPGVGFSDGTEYTAVTVETGAMAQDINTALDYIYGDNSSTVVPTSVGGAGVGVPYVPLTPSP